MSSPPGAAPDGGAGRERLALEAERERLLDSIRDIEADHAAGELADDDYQSLRDDYTVRAAEILRRLGSPVSGPAPYGAAEAAAAPGQEEGPVAVTTRRRRRRLRAGVAAVGAALVAGGALLLVQGASTARQPGGTVSGNVPPSPAQEMVAARHAMAGGDQAMALRLYQAVLSVEPNQPEALAYSGWLLRLTGDVQGNRSLIDAAVADERAAEAADPAYPDPHFFLGVILLDDLHDPAAAVPQLSAYLASAPSPAVSKSVAPVLARARQEAAQQDGP